MFTGLIEDTGKVINASFSDGALYLEIESAKLVQQIKIGDSVAINGACQTVTDKTHSTFKVFASAQTLSVTTFNDINKGYFVNLERAMRLSDRLDGHIVTGHVDGTAVVEEISKTGDSILFTFTTQDTLCKQIVKKGSVAIDGISLTVFDTNKNTFKIAVIPHTFDNTCIKFYKKGTRVNLETDILAKYVEKYLLSNDNIKDNSSAINMNLLEKNGFI